MFDHYQSMSNFEKKTLLVSIFIILITNYDFIEHCFAFIVLLSNRDYDSSYESLLLKSQLPSLKVRRLRAIALEAFKILNN